MNYDVFTTLEYPKVLDKLAAEASTVIGKELAKALCPADDFAEAKELLDETAEAVAVLEQMTPPFGGIFDIRGMLKKAKIGAVLEGTEFVDLLNTLYAMRSMKQFFKSCELEVPVLKEWAQDIEILGQLEKRLERTFDEHGNLRDDATAELQRIRRGIRSAQSQIKKTLDSLLHSAENQKYFQDAIVTMRGDRYVIPVKLEHRAAFPGIVHDQSSTGATLFIEPLAVVELNNDIKQLTLSERQEVERIYRSLSADVKNDREILTSNFDLLAKFDLTFAKAKLALKEQAFAPKLNDNNITDLRAARHPLIAAEKVVPIDISLGEKYNMLLVTGPNTGGKTVSMKTLGLLSLMAKSGLFITAAPESEIAFYKEIYADIGDEQSIEQSLSTFSAHMTHIAKLLGEVEQGDLLLLDELGAGTDPEEGAALAMAILEQLLQLKVSTVATTHYSELKTFAYMRDDIENACVEFDVKTLCPTYRLLTGIPGSSNAFAISRRIGLPESVVIRAGQLLEADHAQFEHVLNDLEKEKIMYEQRNADITERQQHVKRLEEKLEAMKAELSKKKASIISKAKEDSAALVRKARRESEAVIKELKEQFDDQGIKKRQQVIRESRERLNAVSDKVRPTYVADNTFTKPIDLETIAIGDTVFVQTLNQKGNIAEIRGKELVVQLGSMKMTVAAKKCRFVAAAPKVSTTDVKHAAVSLSKVSSVHRELDIRGVMVDEGEQLTAKFLDDAVLAGLKQVLIIHGKGTGALRKGIHAFLKQHKNVSDFNFADSDEGGTGATLVSLK